MARLFSIFVALVAVIGSLSAAVIPIQRANDVSVTVTYTAKTPVDETHKIWVFLFDTPAFLEHEARPIGVQTLTKSGEVAVFKSVTPQTVYVAVAYDEKGGYDGNSAPPPPGTPISVYSIDGKGTPAPIKPVGGAKLKLTFGDANRMP